MGMLDEARRWMKDRTTSDENIQGTPKDKIRELSAALGQLTPQERERNVQHVKAYLDYYYVTHQGEKRIPAEMQSSFRQMVEQSNRLTAVENARVVLQQYGGAPTRDTLNESLERSAQQRAKEFSQYRIEPITSREMSWKDLQPKVEQRVAREAPLNTVDLTQRNAQTERSWKDLQPKVEQAQAQAQKQANSQEQKQEKKQSRSRGKGMEISA